LTGTPHWTASGTQRHAHGRSRWRDTRKIEDAPPTNRCWDLGYAGTRSKLLWKIVKSETRVTIFH
jgi:hypothetical protein